MALALAATGAGAADTATQQQQAAALKLIEDAAVTICQTVPTTQTSSGYELSGKAQAEVKGLAAKVTNLGVAGAAKYGSGTSSGVLQKDLANAIQQGNNCRLTVLQTLSQTMLKASAPQPRTAPPKPKTAPAAKPTAVAQAAPPSAPKPSDAAPSQPRPSEAAPQTPSYQPRAAAAPSASVQFYPTTTTYDNTNIEVFPCLQTDHSVTCTLYVTAGPRGNRWMMDGKSNLLDENGATIPPGLITVGNFSHDPTQGGKIVELSPGTRTRVLYRYDGILDATKLQTLNITVCCIRNLSFHRQ